MKVGLKKKKKTQSVFNKCLLIALYRWKKERFESVTQPSMCFFLCSLFCGMA